MLSTAAVVALTKRRFEEVLAVVVVGMLLALYLFGLLGILSLGYDLIITTTVIATAALTVLLLFKRIDAREFFSNFFTVGFVVFVLAYTAVFVSQTGHTFAVWDELSHWRPFLFETLRLDRLYSDPAANIFVHKNYPPLMTLQEYFWCRMNGRIDMEPMAFRSLNTLAIILVLPVLKIVKWEKKVSRNILKVLVAFTLSLAIPSLILPAYGTVYIDACLGLLIGYGLSSVFLDVRFTAFSTFRLGTAMAAIVLAKESGTPFVFLIMMVFIIDRYCVWKSANPHLPSSIPELKLMILPILKSLVIVSILVAMPVWFKSTWANQVAGIDLSQLGYLDFNKVSIGSMLDILTRNAPEYQTSTFVQFLLKAIGTPITTMPIGLSYMEYVLMLFLFSTLLCIAIKNEVDRRRLFLSAAIVSLGGILYGISVGLGIVLTYGDGFAQTLNSWDRHLDVFLVAFSSLVYYLVVLNTGKFITQMSRDSRRLIYILFASVLVMFSPLQTFLYQFAPMYENSHALAISQTYKVQGEELLSVADSKVDKVYIVATTYQYILFRNVTLSLESNGYDTFPKDSNAWIDELRQNGYTLVYLLDIDAKFAETFGMCFSDPQTIKADQGYRVSESDGKVMLIALKPTS